MIDRHHDSDRAAFTLLEVIATLLLVVIGLASVIGMARLATRWAGEAVAAATGMATAWTAVADARPLGKTADLGDADSDGWSLVSGSLTISPSGSYTFVTAGVLNGYYVRRSESSSTSDIIHGGCRYADVTVDVFWGREGRYITGLKHRILRRL